MLETELQISYRPVYYTQFLNQDDNRCNPGHGLGQGALIQGVMRRCSGRVRYAFFCISCWLGDCPNKISLLAFVGIWLAFDLRARALAL